MRIEIEIECPSETPAMKIAIKQELDYALATAFDPNTNPRFPMGLEINYEIIGEIK